MNTHLWISGLMGMGVLLLLVVSPPCESSEGNEFSLLPVPPPELLGGDFPKPLLVTRMRAGRGSSHSGITPSVKDRNLQCEQPSRHPGSTRRHGPTSRWSQGRSPSDDRAPGIRRHDQSRRRPHRKISRPRPWPDEPLIVFDTRTLSISHDDGDLGRDLEQELSDRASTAADSVSFLERKIRDKNTTLQQAAHCAWQLQEQIREPTLSPPKAAIEFFLKHDLPFPRPDREGRYGPPEWGMMLATVESYIGRLRGDIATCTLARDQALRQYETAGMQQLRRLRRIPPGTSIIILRR